MEKLGNIEKTDGQYNREMETLRVGQTCYIKNTDTEMRNAFDKPISRLDLVRKESVNLMISKRNFPS